MGGISTPIGTGPNAIAIASISETSRISFLGWMSFALPLAIGMLILSFALIWLQVRKRQGEWSEKIEELSEKVFDMLLGCLIISLTGRSILNLVGIS